MPIYRFQCQSCGLNFTSRVAPGVTETRCECGVQAPSTLPRTVNTGLSVKVTENGPTTTGFSGMDYNADRAIGEYSTRKWGEIRERQKLKEDIIQATGATGFDLSKTPDGNYRVMTPEERSASERSRQFHFNVLKKAPPPDKKP